MYFLYDFKYVFWLTAVEHNQISVLNNESFSASTRLPLPTDG